MEYAIHKKKIRLQKRENVQFFKFQIFIDDISLPQKLLHRSFPLLCWMRQNEMEQLCNIERFCVRYKH